MTLKTQNSTLKTDHPVFAIGIMSGTSVDGIDAVLVAIAVDGAGRLALEVDRHVYREFTPEVVQQIKALMLPGADELERAGQLHKQLAELYAEAALALLPTSPRPPVAVLGCHGQTVRHRPNLKPAFSWQLGCGATLAARTQIPVVTDFRSADMACGGQGAPFAPFLHQALFTSAAQHRAIVNLGGIANLTYLPKPGDGDVLGFDTGPANALLDSWYQQHHRGHYDAQGRWGAAGRVNPGLLNLLLQDPYFSQAAPKSTGREYFSHVWLTHNLRRFAEQNNSSELRAVDVQATLAALSAQSIADQLNALQPPLDAIYVCGGGVHNAALMQMLGQASRAALHSCQVLGFDPQHIEACTFAWLAYQTLKRTRATIPSVTGARRASIAGALYFPN